MLRKTLILLAAILLTAGLAASSGAQRETIDRIAVVVGSEVVLASEITSQVQLYALQSGRRPQNEQELKELENQIVEQMISDRLFLIAAREDTSLSVRPEEIESALDDRIANIARNFPSDEQFLAVLAQEGMTIRQLKKQYRTDIENQLLKQRYIQQKLYSVSISKHEVEKFYGEFKDSIPTQPEAVKLAHILLTVEPSEQVEDSVKLLATELRQRILDGADFATIASQYSSMGAGANGGDLGYVSREDVVEEFARAAFNLTIGDISGVIRSQFGYHVIKCEGKKEDRLWLRHVLLAVPPAIDDSARVQLLADSLLQAARGGGDFAEMAKEFSTDNSSRAQGGELGWISTAQAPPDIAPTLIGWQTPGEYRGPVETSSGIHILKLLDYAAEKAYTIEDDFDGIKELARQDKTGRLVDKWIAELKTKTYIDFRLDENAN